MGQRVLVIEDDPSIRMLLEEELGFQGLEARFCSDGLQGYEAVQAWSPDLVILDLMLPGSSGLDVCRRLRGEGYDLPIILLTARDREADKVRGLDAGANDYVTKPFGLAELVARVRAHLRERERSLAGERPLVVGDLRIEPRRLRASRDGQALDLTRKEFEILGLLMECGDGTVSREEFLERLWPGTYVTPRTIDTHVSTLRRKLGTTDRGEEIIVGVRGVGYRLNASLTGQE